MTLKKDDSLQLLVHDISSSGEGIATHEGFKIFIDGALPSERVQARIQLVKKNYATAKLVRVVEPSTHRIKPPCPYFGACGGCQIMHLDQERQLEAKRKRVQAAFRKIAKLDPLVEECLPSPQFLAYRNKIQMPFSDKGMGLFRKGSHEVIPIDACLIHCSVGEEVFRAVKEILEEVPKGSLRHVLIKSAVYAQKVLVVLVTHGRVSMKELADKIYKSSPHIVGVVENINRDPGNRILGKRMRPLCGKPYMMEMMSGLKIKVSPAAFFQVNTPQAENLYAYALDIAKLSEGDVVCDAFCGVGVLTSLIAQKVKKVYGVEVVKEAISDARENASRNGIENTEFLVGKVEDLFSTLPHFSVVFVNPPRKGCDPHFLEQLAKKRPKCIIYISCDPATLARDCAYLIDRGYSLQNVQPFDLFPQTSHVETVCLLELK